MLGGISGHAGLFSNSYEVALMLQTFLQGGIYDGIRLFDKNGRGGRHIELDRIYIEETYVDALEKKVLK